MLEVIKAVKQGTCNIRQAELASASREVLGGERPGLVVRFATPMRPVLPEALGKTAKDEKKNIAGFCPLINRFCLI